MSVLLSVSFLVFFYSLLLDHIVWNKIYVYKYICIFNFFSLADLAVNLQDIYIKYKCISMPVVITPLLTPKTSL